MREVEGMSESTHLAGSIGLSIHSCSSDIPLASEESFSHSQLDQLSRVSDSGVGRK